MAWPTRYELSHASIYWPAVFIDFVIATIVALLLRYVFFSEGNSVFSWADSLLSREDGPVDYSVTEPDQLDPSYIWDWGCLRDGFTVGPEVSSYPLPRWVKTDYDRFVMARSTHTVLRMAEVSAKP